VPRGGGAAGGRQLLTTARAATTRGSRKPSSDGSEYNEVNLCVMNLVAMMVDVMLVNIRGIAGETEYVGTYLIKFEDTSSRGPRRRRLWSSCVAGWNISLATLMTTTRSATEGAWTM
jgi:hypothetical protein